MRITLIINPKSPATVTTLQQGVESLRGAGHTVNGRLTFERRDARGFARDAAAEGVDLVVACGGDGTVNEVVNGLQDFLRAPGQSQHPAPRLGIVPLGTGNDFAGAYGIPEEPEDALAVAVIGLPRRVDIPTVNGRAFLNVSTGGIGAEATDETPDTAKRFLGTFAYAITGVRKLVELRATPARFSAAEMLFEGKFLLFAVGNGRRTGGGNWLTPRAELDDGLLDLCVVPEISRMDFVNLLPLLRAGAHVDHPEVLYWQVPRVEVVAAEELSLNADGEPLRGQRFEYNISPYPLEISLPE